MNQEDQQFPPQPTIPPPPMPPGIPSEPMQPIGQTTPLIKSSQLPMQPQNMQQPISQPAQRPQVVVPQTPQNAQMSGINMQSVATPPFSSPQEDAPTPQQVAQNPTPNYSERGGGEGQNLANVPEEFLKLFEHDGSEVIMYQATRHPVGVWGIYGVAGIAVIGIILTLVFLASDSTVFGTMSANFISIATIVGLFLIAIVVGVSFVGAYVYQRTRLILTNQKIVLIQYHSLFAREVSQLNIGEVEDVNVAQKTILDRILHTGTITVETSGEQNNYQVSQIEKPHEFAQKTIQAHEGSIAQYGN